MMWSFQCSPKLMSLEKVLIQLLKISSVSGSIRDKKMFVGVIKQVYSAISIGQSSVHPDWNFYKYLVDHNGKVVKAWSTKTTIEDLFDR